MRGEYEAVLGELAPSLPHGAPRYLMGVGFREDLLGSVARGMDLDGTGRVERSRP